MDKKARVDMYAKEIVVLTATFEDFDGDEDKWRNSLYELFRWQMTWDFAYKIDVVETRKGVRVKLHIKPAFEESATETMEHLGYRNIRSEAEEIGSIECTELPDDMLIDFAVIDY